MKVELFLVLERLLCGAREGVKSQRRCPCVCNPVAKLDERSSVGIAHHVGLNDTTDKKSKTGLCHSPGAGFCCS